MISVTSVLAKIVSGITGGFELVIPYLKVARTMLAGFFKSSLVAIIAIVALFRWFFLFFQARWGDALYHLEGIFDIELDTDASGVLTSNALYLLEFCNYLLPLNEFLLAFTALISVWVAALTYKIFKSFVVGAAT